MKFNISHLLVVFFLVVLMACKQEKEEVFPPGDTDNTSVSEEELDEFLNSNKFSDSAGSLYGKPLEEIQRSIIGKWKVAISMGGFAGISYPKDQYVTIDENTFEVNYGIIPCKAPSFDYEWKYLKTYDGYESYVLWDKQNPTDADILWGDLSDLATNPAHVTPNGFVFAYLLHNDTLVMNSYSRIPFSNILFRVKE